LSGEKIPSIQATVPFVVKVTTAEPFSGTRALGCENEQVVIGTIGSADATDAIDRGATNVAAEMIIFGNLFFIVQNVQ
jgi:hypothetical protein